MSTDISLKCRCGAVRGIARDVSAANGNRIVCHCADCQSFGHYLERADEILDAHGGTDIFQMAPARLEITNGADQLRCMRLTENGLRRWYVDCCKTPVGNTLGSAQLPFVGLIHSFMDHEGDGRSRDEALGPVRFRVLGREASGDRSTLDAHDGRPASLLRRLLSLWFVARLRGEHAPSPFFDSKTGATTVTPRVLTDVERDAVVASRRAAQGRDQRAAGLG